MNTLNLSIELPFKIGDKIWMDTSDGFGRCNFLNRYKKVKEVEVTSIETLKKKKPQFKPFDKVLVRDNETLKWKCAFYSYFEPFSKYHHVIAGTGAYVMCIPFEGNEHLVGTTKNP